MHTLRKYLLLAGASTTKPSIAGLKQEITQVALPESVMARLRPMSGVWCSRCHFPTGWRAERVDNGASENRAIQPDKKLDGIWAEAAEERLKAHRDGKLEGVLMEEVFKDK